MTLSLIGIAISYVVIAVLLLSLNLASRWHWGIKASAIGVTTIFFGVSYGSIAGLIGWPSAARVPKSASSREWTRPGRRESSTSQKARRTRISGSWGRRRGNRTSRAAPETRPPSSSTRRRSSSKTCRHRCCRPNDRCRRSLGACQFRCPNYRNLDIALARDSRAALPQRPRRCLGAEAPVPTGSARLFPRVADRRQELPADQGRSGLDVAEPGRDRQPRTACTVNARPCRNRRARYGGWRSTTRYYARPCG